MTSVDPLNITDAQLQCAVVLVVNDDPTTTEFLVQALSPFYRVFSAESGEDAIGFCAMHAPELVILDLFMPDLDGLLTCKMLRSIPSMKNCPILFSTADTSVEQELDCWDAGATDFVTKPIVTQTLVKRINVHIRTKLLSDMHENSAFIDPQSGLYNRRYFNDCYQKQISLAKRNDDPLSLVLFKVLDMSDSAENQTLNAVSTQLKQVSQIVSDSLSRPTDTLIRYSENELAVLLPDTYVFGAKHIVQKVLAKIADLEYPAQEKVTETLHVQAGMASLEALNKNLSLIEQVEKNLQQNTQFKTNPQNQYYQ
jgi:diguanylate cyclase (GGDEF)-like protein